MTSVHLGRPVTDSILAAVAAVGLLVGDAGKPASGGWQGVAGQSTFNGYLILYPFGGSVDGTIGNPVEDAEVRYHLNAVGATRQQCEQMLDTARTALLAATVAVSGRATSRLWLDQLGGVARDDDVQPPIWIGFDRYRLMTWPSAA